MSNAEFIPALGMWVSLMGIIGVGVLGGVLLFFSEKMAARHRLPH